MGLSEMFGDQSVGNPAGHPSSDLEIKQVMQPDVQQSINPDGQPSNLPYSQQSAMPSVHLAEGMESQKNVKPSLQLVSQPNSLSKPSKNQRIPTCKMTFNLREDIHKAFNDLYANRILQGRASEKSEMICEAIQLLINKEERLK